MRKQNGELPPATRLSIRQGRNQAPTLEECQDFVGGYIEVVHLPNGDQLIVNEEGRMEHLQLPHNPAASVLARRNIVGNALLLQGDARLS